MADADVVALLERANHSIQFQTQSETTGPTGARLPGTFTNNGAAMIGWVQPASTSVVVAYGARGIRITHRAYLSADPSVKAGDRAVYDSRTLIVRGIKNASELGRIWIVDLEETLT